jgi:hypothetical protein
MQEVKRPKKPLIYFYVAMILAILVFNCLVVRDSDEKKEVVNG